MNNNYIYLRLSNKIQFNVEIFYGMIYKIDLYKY